MWTLYNQTQFTVWKKTLGSALMNEWTVLCYLHTVIFHLFIYLLISFFGHSLWNVLIQDVASYECRCRWNCYQKSNSHRGNQHYWNETKRRKKSLSWNNNNLLKTGNLIQNKPLLRSSKFLKEPPTRKGLKEKLKRAQTSHPLNFVFLE